MTQKRWSTTEISAYLDGALTPRDQTALDTQLRQDPALQRRVEEMQEVVALVRAVPLRQSPRNYLLSPAMVSEPKPQPKARRTPLLLMRLATSLVALAFVVTFGINVLQNSNLLRGAMAPMAVQSDAQPEAEAVPESAYDTLAEDETAMVMTERQAPEPLTAQAVEEPVELAAPPLPEELAERVEAGEVLGMGGPIEEDEAVSPENRLAESPEEVAVAAIEAEEESAVETMLIPAEEPEESPPPAEGMLSETEVESPSTQALKRGPTPPSVWITIGLGLATAVFAAITIWLSRRNTG